MSENGIDWIGVLDGKRLLGWVDRSDIEASGPAKAEPRPFAVSLAPSSSLREALDAVVTGHARIAVVVENGEYRGMLDLEAIAEEITE
jgi:CBS domain-containing protein